MILQYFVVFPYFKHKYKHVLIRKVSKTFSLKKRQKKEKEGKLKESRKIKKRRRRRRKERIKIEKRKILPFPYPASTPTLPVSAEIVLADCISAKARRCHLGLDFFSILSTPRSSSC
jgi:hypothetical protein